MPSGQIPPVTQKSRRQLILYHSIHLLVIIGSIIAVALFPANSAVAWIFSLGFLNCVLIRLPARCFGDSPEEK